MLTSTQLIPQATREQERAQLLEKICDNFKKVCEMMDGVHKDTSQHVKVICRMKLEVLPMQGKATIKSHEATALWDMIQKDWDMINQFIEVVKELKGYTNALGQIKVVRERLQSMDFHISELQMRPSTQVLEDQLARLEDRLQDQHEEIAIFQGWICLCGQQGGLFGTFSIYEKPTKHLSSTGVTTCHKFIRRRGRVGVGLC